MPKVTPEETADHDALIQELREHVGRLTALIEQQQRQIEAQRADYDQRLAAQQEEISALQACVREPESTRTDDTAHAGAQAGSTPRQQLGRGTSRRRLLAGAGVAAAAATVALVASEQGAHAAPANDGDAIIAGHINTASSTTFLEANSGASGTLLVLENNAGSGDGLHVFSSSGNAGIYGFGNGAGDGVQGATGSGIANGVFGTNTSSGNGVYGTASTNGNGVQGYAPGGVGYGVWGRSDSGYGLVGEVSTGIDIATNGSNRIYQRTQVFVGAPTSGTYNKGEQIRDSNGELFICLVGGSPGTWVRLSHPTAGYSGGATTYLSKPIRLLDTRGSDPNAKTDGGGPYTSGGSPYSLQIAGVSWMSVSVPSGAVGAIGKVTAVSTGAGGGFIALVPGGSGIPTTGTLPYGTSATVATSFNVGLGGSPGALDIYIGGNPTDVVIDLFGVVA